MERIERSAQTEGSPSVLDKELNPSQHAPIPEGEQMTQGLSGFVKARLESLKSFSNLPFDRLREIEEKHGYLKRIRENFETFAYITEQAHDQIHDGLSGAVNPSIEVQQILTASRTNRPEALRAVKEMVAKRREGAANLYAELISIIRENPDSGA